MKKKILLLLSLGIFLSIIILIYAADRVVGNKFNKVYAGWNSEGYRGIKKSKKENGFKRIVTVGGSTTFGYGTRYDESWPFLLEKQFLNNQIKIDVANLGHLYQGIWAIRKDLIHYNYLDYDYVIFYNGYNDTNPNEIQKGSARHYNPIFKLFGYLPILDTYIYEKMVKILYGNLDLFYANKTKNNHQASFSLDKNNNPVRKQIQKKQINSNKITNEKTPYESYVNEYKKTFEYLLENKKKIIFIHQPKLKNHDKIQKREINNFLKSFPEVIQLKYTELIDLSDLTISRDYMHLTPKGNHILAKKIFEDLKNQLINQFN